MQSCIIYILKAIIIYTLDCGFTVELKRKQNIEIDNILCAAQQTVLSESMLNTMNILG